MKTISSELSKELEELGVKQDSYCVWFFEHENNLEKEPYLIPKISLPDIIDDNTEIYAAFTLDEILDMLPLRLEIQIDNDSLPLTNYLNISKWGDSDYYTFTYNHRTYNLNLCMTDVYNDSKNSTEAAGRLLKWCIENNYIVTDSS